MVNSGHFLFLSLQVASTEMASRYDDVSLRSKLRCEAGLGTATGGISAVLETGKLCISRFCKAAVRLSVMLRGWEWVSKGGGGVREIACPRRGAWPYLVSPDRPRGTQPTPNREEPN